MRREVLDPCALGSGPKHDQIEWKEMLLWADCAIVVLRDAKRLGSGTALPVLSNRDRRSMVYVVVHLGVVLIYVCM
jgi:hypothetical protein